MKLIKWQLLLGSAIRNVNATGPCKVRRIRQCFRRFQSSDAKSADTFFDAVEMCDVGQLEKRLKANPALVNRRNGDGLTSLMLSSVLGYESAVDLLLKHDCNTTLRSPSGHTGLELAAFYQNEDVYSLLMNVPEVTPKFEIFFGGNPLNRQSVLRPKNGVMYEYMTSEDSCFILFHYDKWPLVTRAKSSNSSKSGSRPKPDLLRVNYQTLKEVLDEESIASCAVFLGVLDNNDGSSTKPHFAIDISDVDEHLFKLLHPDADALVDRRGVFTLSQEEAAIVGHGRCMLDWNERFRFCSTCGSETLSTHSGHKRKCVNDTCLSNSGIYSSSYPRVDPSIICLVSTPDQSSVVLARSKRYIDSMYSCLAGFIEPGETIEMAVAREMHEEVGIDVSEIQYVASQPWPMPCVLMFGCTACATSTELNIDTNEIEFAAWFSREAVVGMMTRTHPDGLFTPPRQAIAHQLIKQWLIKTAFK